MKKREYFRTLTTVSLLLSITILLANTPLGFIPIGPIAATTLHIPVLVGAVLMGPKIGALMGLLFGLYSMLRAYTTPTVTSFIFMDPMVAVLPRVLMGYGTGLFYALLKKMDKTRITIATYVLGILLMGYMVFQAVMQLRSGGSPWAFGSLGILTLALLLFLWKSRVERSDIYLSAALGTLINTFGVLGMIYIIHAKGYMEVIGQSADSALTVIATIAVVNGIPEVIVATIVVSAVAGAAKKVYRRL